MDRPVGLGVVVDAGLRSSRESPLGVAARRLGDQLQFIAGEAAELGGVLRRALARLHDGEAAVVVGHSPTNEAAILGLTGQFGAPLAKGAGMRIVPTVARSLRAPPAERYR